MSRGAARVAAGILLSRVAGLVRDAAIAFYLGAGAHADVFRAALRGPNVLQNLLGEGTISAAFIPAYTRLLKEGREQDAGRLAGAVLGLLACAAALLSIAGILLARPIVATLTPGFLLDDGALGVNRYELAVEAVRYVFPMTGLLVVSAWALGVLNSHRRFFIAYVAPVLWNLAIIAALFASAAGWLHLEGGTGTARDSLLLGACAGALLGGLLQVAVQLPQTLRLLPGLRVSLDFGTAGVRDVLRAVGPAIAGRGVAQLSSWIDLMLASLLATGAVAVLGWAQTLYLLPISLFGMSVAAAELPELAREHDAGERLIARARAGLGQIAFLVVPAAVGYVLLGLYVVEIVYRRGAFGEADAWLVALALCGYALGLVATTWSRLLQNTFFALADTKSPARIAAGRMVVASVLSVPLMLALDRVSLATIAPFVPGADQRFLGATGLTLASAFGAWLELWWLRAKLARALPGFALPIARAARMAGLALGAAVLAAGVAYVAQELVPLLRGLAVVGTFALVYLTLGFVLRVDEGRPWFARFSRD